MLSTGTADIEQENWHNLNSEKRGLYITLMSSHLRTYFNIAQLIEFDNFALEKLNRFEARAEYIGRLAHV